MRVELLRLRMGLTVLLAVVLLAGGCVAEPDHGLIRLMERGEYGRARVYAAEKLSPQPRAGKKPDRDYLLERMRLIIATLADGYSLAADQVVLDTYEMLRTQGINEDKTVAAVALNEDLKIWKGEPFEQAMAFCYIGLHFAINGDWGNLQAAAENSLFYLRDFGGRSAEDLATSDDDDALDDYTPVKSNFTLGYLLNAIAHQQLGDTDLAEEKYAAAVGIDPSLAGLAAELRRGDYNTLLVVDFGRGPQKIATGPDRAIAKFAPVFPSGGEPLVLTLGGESRRVPQVMDVNPIATDLMWNNLQDVRLAKSYLGSAMVGAGAIIAGVGAQQRSAEVALAGLGVALAGAAMKAGAHADTRHLEILPQRTYVVPTSVSSADERLVLQIAGVTGAHLALTGLSPPPPGVTQLRYVRMPHPYAAGGGLPEEDWVSSGEVAYANPVVPRTPYVMAPYILGGHDVRPPTYEVMADYHDAGYLLDMRLEDLVELYRIEGIELEVAPGRMPKLHVLDGGKSLVAPLGGTAGFARLFGQLHRPYRPRSQEVRQAQGKVLIEAAEAVEAAQ